MLRFRIGGVAGSPESVHAVDRIVHIFSGVRILQFVPAAVEVMPFAQMKTGIAVAVFFRQFPDLGRLALLAHRTGIILIPGHEVELQTVFAAPGEKSFDLIEHTAAPAGTAELKFRQPFGKFLRRDLIQVEILFRGAGPEFPFVGLAPDRPVFDVFAPAETVGLATGVMFGYPAADFGPFFIILRRMGEITFRGVLDGFSQPVFHGQSEVDTGLQIVIGLFEIIIFRIGGIGIEIGEDLMDVDQSHAGIVERDVMQPYGPNVQFAIEVAASFPGIDVGHLGRQRDAVHRFEFPDRPFEVDFHHFSVLAISLLVQTGAEHFR